MILKKKYKSFITKLVVAMKRNITVKKQQKTKEKNSEQV